MSVERKSIISRCCDDSICAICDCPILTSDIAGEVTKPEKQLSRLKVSTRQAMKVKWDSYPNKKTVYLHYSCWNNVLVDSTATEIRMLNRVSQTFERYDSIDHIKERVLSVADMILESNRVVCFTGAGISASSGISTYRGAHGKLTQLLLY
jgi:hypothetical protein